MNSSHAAGTPLVKPSPLTADESRLLVKQVDGYDEVECPSLRKVVKLEPDTQALFKGILDRGVIRPVYLEYLMHKMELDAKYPRNVAVEHNAFLVLSHMRKRGWINDSPGGLLSASIRQIICGVYYPVGAVKPEPLKKITTVEELESVAASVFAADELGIPETVESPFPDGPLTVDRLGNRYLVDYVWSHPADVEMIIEWVRDRGLDPEDESLNGLREALDEAHRSLNEGWL